MPWRSSSTSRPFSRATRRPARGLGLPRPGHCVAWRRPRRARIFPTLSARSGKYDHGNEIEERSQEPLGELHAVHPAFALPAVALGAWFVAPFAASALALDEAAPPTENPPAPVNTPLTPTPGTAPPNNASRPVEVAAIAPSTSTAGAAAPIDVPSGNSIDLIGALFGSNRGAASQPAPMPPPQSGVAPAQPWSPPVNKRAKEPWEERHLIGAHEKQAGREDSEPSRSADQPRTAEARKINDNRREDAPRANVVGRKAGEGEMPDAKQVNFSKSRQIEAPSRAVGTPTMPVHAAAMPTVNMAERAVPAPIVASSPGAPMMGWHPVPQPMRPPMFCCGPVVRPFPAAPFGYGRPMMVSRPFLAVGGFRRH
jgi:hypothetical protein